MTTPHTWGHVVWWHHEGHHTRGRNIYGIPPQASSCSGHYLVSYIPLALKLRQWLKVTISYLYHNLEFQESFWCSVMWCAFPGWGGLKSAVACVFMCLVVTGPPGTLLFDRDQRSHWNRHYNCCFIRVAALDIYCTVFLPQMLIQVRYPMQSVGHHIWQ